MFRQRTVARGAPFLTLWGPDGNMEPRDMGPGPGRFLACACFFTDNLFVPRYGLHLRYWGDPEQLRRDYGPALRQRGCRSEEEFEAVIQEVEKEVQRRKELDHQSRERKTVISQNYRPKHPQLYTLQESFLAPEFLEAVKCCTSKCTDLQGLLSHVESVSDKRIYRLPIFSKEFCHAFIEELENFEQSEMPKGRPNSMNNYGDANPVPKYIEIEHVPFHGLFHRGGQMHGALPIASGERWNLIVWMRSSAVRNQLCPMCNREPELVHAKEFGEGFTRSFEDRQPETMDMCSLT
ncbi:2-oxoglutarate and iron-dependent oxygenase domain-containing protein 2 isoform X3 [Rhineura floridana]|uniref:2-oxoglutarate and iron-dependent oxygenase domain-containing protein 2 isoform X3 n=1 Tax=Rhineura floridana TaxID=261503 RepID=UPI002AC80290|nr:2-oxoglutarate and iron-dependent oxygenase domain-containing protein 2 isoform X3 [Rhineura floridana]